MTLLNAPDYDARKETRRKTVLITSGSAVVLLILLTLAGFASGHGWLFSNLPAEHKVDKFFSALQRKDYREAFAIYNNDAGWESHPEKYKEYPESRFEEDWSKEEPVKGPVRSYHVDISRTDGEGTFGTGIIVAVTVNGDKRVFMYYLRKTGALTWPAFHEIQY